ncbi:ribonuclease toxin HepT-like protein [Aerophototrophica crusticola]|uniref:ribonuclease toxin HepT-like protein n=1 Tax=Aerophototrophica crusticola TaxID=1709002 RepID=UPI003850D420
MAGFPVIWPDLAESFAQAEALVAEASAQAEGLDDPSSDSAHRVQREVYVGYLLHNAYCAVERALEQLVLAVDGGLPSGARYHAELVRALSLPAPIGHRLRHVGCPRP